MNADPVQAVIVWSASHEEDGIVLEMMTEMDEDDDPDTDLYHLSVKQAQTLKAHLENAIASLKVAPSLDSDGEDPAV